MSRADPFGLIGQLLDAQFRVDALIGEGGFSAVYRGTHVGLDEPIAIKCLKLTGALAQMSGGSLLPMGGAQDPSRSSAPPPPAMSSAVVDSFVKRFRDESRILYRLSQGNLNVVRCIASGTTMVASTGALVPYMVLEWLEGRSLDADLQSRAGKPRTLAETMSLFEPAFDAMTHAHSMGVIHRDLSTGNIFLAKQRDGSSRAKVLDFGVAKVMTDDLELGPRTQTLTQIRIFSPAYAAPEQFDARLSPAGPFTDVYSLALIATEVLAGRHVRTGETLGAMMQQALDPNAPRTPRALGVNVPDAIEQVFARALSIDAKKRQKDASELWRELRGAQSIAHSSAGRPSMDLGATTRLNESPEEKPPSTDPMAPDPPKARRQDHQMPPDPSAATQGLKSTVRMSTDPPQAGRREHPTSTPPSPQLFQPVAVPPPPGTPAPAATGSFAGVIPPLPDPPKAGRHERQLPPPALKQTQSPVSKGGTERAQWLVGLLVFIFVLAAGGVALRFWFLH